ncbi:MAG TPA: asparagine synthase (glutamine-hydrolyzing) [Tepidisphaeraceae bacterium]|nr:asparagine synthase (glutamine-hydrolyzing) [Tepidisphaeraceae bacterium]
MREILLYYHDMCGWAGFWQIAGESEEALKARASAMAETLRHRGPNDGGAWADPAAGIGLGFRRLSILDLSPAGHQPMVSASGRYVLAFNGEIYNFQLLRAELEKFGHAFRGHSDSEVMLAAFEQWGIQPAVEKFNGMFAFALWDRTERKLTLCRDRLGIKPLYFGRFGKTLLFASQPKAFFAHPHFVPAVEPAAMSLYVRFNCIPARWSIYQNVQKLEPGRILTLHASDDSAEPISYWSAQTVAEAGMANPLAIDLEEAADRLDELLGDAVKLRMIADVPIGAFLSGGIDSSAIVAMMQKAGGRAKTFTIGFDASEYDESPHARAIAAHLGTAHTELRLTTPDAQTMIPDLPEFYDEPFADSSQIPTMLVSRLARQHVAVSLSGDGADETFGGYDRYFAVQKLWRIPSPIRRIAAAPLRLSRPYSARTNKLVDALAQTSPGAIYTSLQSVTRRPGMLLAGKDPESLCGEHLEPDASPLRWMLRDTVRYLPDDLLAKVDRASMSVALEVRVPMLDHRVVEFAWQLPMDVRVGRMPGKRVLREVLSRYVPAKLWDRPKRGFAVPIAKWLRGGLRPWAEELLGRKRLAEQEIYSPTAVRKMWRDHRSGRDHGERLWGVLMFQAWWERWMKGR